MLDLVKYIYQVPRSLLQNEKNFVPVEFAAFYYLPNNLFSRLKRQTWSEIRALLILIVIAYLFGLE